MRQTAPTLIGQSRSSKWSATVEDPLNFSASTNTGFSPRLNNTNINNKSFGKRNTDGGPASAINKRVRKLSRSRSRSRSASKERQPRNAGGNRRERERSRSTSRSRKNASPLQIRGSIARGGVSKLCLSEMTALPPHQLLDLTNLSSITKYSSSLPALELYSKFPNLYIPDDFVHVQVGIICLLVCTNI